MAQLEKTIGALFCVLCLVVPLTSGKSVHFENCSGTHVANVSGLDISPSPVHAGETFTFTINASTDTKIDGGSLEISIILGGREALIQTLNLCQTTTCPVTEGAFTISHNQFIYPNMASGQKLFHIKASDTNGGTLICIYFAMEVVS